MTGGPGFSWLLFAAKLVPVTALLLWLAPPRGPYGTLIFAGLLLSLTGDAFLALPGDLFLAGLSAFLAAHLCYIAAFMSENREMRILRLLPYAVWVGGVYLFLYPKFGALAAPVGVYCLVIAVMMWRASELGRLAAVAGAILFGLSDTLLALIRFEGGFPTGGAVLILAYWAGQFGIAWSAQRGVANSVPPV